MTTDRLDASAPVRPSLPSRIALGALAGLASGSLMVLAIRPYGVWPLILVGLVPMFVAQHRLLPRRWCWLPVSLTAYLWVLGSYSQIFWDSKRSWALLAPLAVAVVAAVQPGNLLATLGKAPTPAQVAEIQDSLASRTRLAAAAGARLVVWPEEVLPADPRTGPPQLRAWFDKLLRETNVYRYERKG